MNAMSDEPAARRDRTIARLEQFRAFKPGWDLGRGDAMDPAVLDMAERIVLAASYEDIWKTSAFPSPSGEVLLAFPLSPKLDIELYVRADGLVDFTCEKNGKIVKDLDGLSEEDALTQLRLYGKPNTVALWLSEFLTPPYITTQKSVVSEVRPSRHLLTADCQPLTEIVLLSAHSPSATMYFNTTPTALQATLRGTGLSMSCQ